MSDSAARFHWSLASSLMALIANCNRGPKSRVLTPDDFNPLAKRKKVKVKISFFKDYFVPKEIPPETKP